MDNSFLVGQTIITTLFYVWCLIIAGALLYFIDGLLPLLRAYYKVFFDPHREIATKQRQITTSAKIAAALLVSPVNYTAHCCSTTSTPCAGVSWRVGRASDIRHPSEALQGNSFDHLTKGRQGTSTGCR